MSETGEYDNNDNIKLLRPRDPSFLYYQCAVRYSSIFCWYISSEKYVPFTDSVLVSVPRWLPRFFHPYYLYFHMIPKRIQMLNDPRIH